MPTAMKGASCCQTRLKRLMRRIVLLMLLLACAGLLCVGVSEGWVHALSRGLCHKEVQDCPQGSVGLVLGCSKYLKRGYRNYYYTGRMEAAAALWESGRVSCLIVSGDNRHRSYNEPRDMKNSLVELGVPADKIVCDYAGLCTYDSVMRASRIFGAQKLTIVSQPSHVRRAVAIARHLGIEAEGLDAPLPPLTRSSHLRAFVRERGARISMLYDFITDRTPTHMGQPESLPPVDMTL